MQWTAEQIIAMGSVIAVVIGAIFAKPVVDAVLKVLDWWRAGRERRMAKKALDEERRLAQEALDDELNDKGHKFIIRRLDRRVTQLEDERKLDAIRYQELEQEHGKCREEFAVIQSKYDGVCKRLAKLEGTERH